MKSMPQTSNNSTSRIFCNDISFRLDKNKNKDVVLNPTLTYQPQNKLQYTTITKLKEIIKN
jgi:predicted AAA+ superfamily ATPase